MVDTPWHMLGCEKQGSAIGTEVARAGRNMKPTVVLPVVFAFLVACGGTEQATSGAPERVPSEASEGEASEASKTLEELPLASFCEGGTGQSYDAVVMSIFDSLAPAPAATYLALRRNVGAVPSPGLSEEMELVTDRGQLCGDAPDVDQCKSAYDALRPPIRDDYQYCYTRGDTATCVENVADAIVLLGQVHTVNEAFFVAGWEGYSPSCKLPSRGKALADGSFDLVVEQRRGGRPCGQIFRANINVTSDGTITERDATLLDDSPSCP